MTKLTKKVCTAWLLCWALASGTAAGQATLEQRLFPASQGTRFGSVAIEDDWAVVGAPEETVDGAATAGAVYVYNRTANGSWTQVQRLTASNNASQRFFGSSVAMEGTRLVVGAPSGFVASQFGAVYVFERAGTSFVETAFVPQASGNPLSGFGASVALSGDTMFVGNPYGGQGSAYVLRLVGGVWTQTWIVPPANSDRFGLTVSVSGTTACIGSPSDTVAGASFQGRAHIYTESGGTWSLARTLVASDGAATDYFGTSCVTDGTTTVVGAPYDAQAVNDQGSVYVFVGAGSAWTQQAKLFASSPQLDDRFGYSLAMRGNTLVAGSLGRFTTSSPGRAVVFNRTGATWFEAQSIGTADGAISHGFGRYVAMSDLRLMVGAGNFSVGYAHIYRRSGGSNSPGAPTNFQGRVNGNVVGLSWGAPASGGSPTSYTLQVVGGPSYVLGLTNSFSSNAPNGVYSLRMVASNASGTGPASNTVTLTVPATVAAPGPPTNLAVTVAGSTVSFSWAPPTSGGTVAGYSLLAGTTPGFATQLASLPLPASATTLSVPGVGAGTYYARLVAQNAGGTGPPSNEVTLTVAGAAAPSAPTLNPPTVLGSTVTLAWSAGASGGAPTSYVLGVTGALTTNVPLTGTSISVPNVPSGTYFLRLIAMNGVGSSPPSAQVTLVVP